MVVTPQLRAWAQTYAEPVALLCADPELARGRCVAEADLLLRALRAEPPGPPGRGDAHGPATAYLVRVRGREAEREHWAVALLAEPLTWPEVASAAVIDLTARQFDAAVAYPWVGALADWATVAADWLGGQEVTVEVHGPNPVTRGENPTRPLAVLHQVP